MGAKALHDISPRIRKAFWDGMRELCRRKQKTLAEVVADELEKDFVPTVQAFSRFQVKQVQAQVNVNHQLPDTLLAFAKAYAEEEKGKGVELEGELTSGTIPSIQALEGDTDIICQ